MQITVINQIIKRVKRLKIMRKLKPLIFIAIITLVVGFSIHTKLISLEDEGVYVDFGSNVGIGKQM